MQENQTKYNEIKKLAALMTAEGVPFERKRMFNGEMLILWGKDGRCLADAIEHDYSYGSEDDLLEISGAVAEKELGRDPVGNLTAEEVLRRFKYCYENNTSILPVVDSSPTTAHEKLAAFVADPRYTQLSDEDMIVLFLQENFASLCDIMPSLVNLMAKRCISLEHKCNVKDEYLTTVQNWLKGEIHKDEQFHPELKDKMIDNIRKALEI